MLWLPRLEKILRVHISPAHYRYILCTLRHRQPKLVNQNSSHSFGLTVNQNSSHSFGLTAAVGILWWRTVIYWIVIIHTHVVDTYM